MKSSESAGYWYAKRQVLGETTVNVSGSRYVNVTRDRRQSMPHTDCGFGQSWQFSGAILTS